MGKELTCTMRYRGGAHAGRLYLETDYLLFRGDTRLKLTFAELTSVTAAAGVLKICVAGEEAAFELGADAAKCADKILHPPSLLTKLGIRQGIKVTLIGAFNQNFVGDLEEAGATFAPANADVIFLAVDNAEQLRIVAQLAARLEPKKAIWIVYPKGVAVIREIDVIRAGRVAGLKDTKVAAFSKTHTALRFSKSETPA